MEDFILKHNNSRLNNNSNSNGKRKKLIQFSILIILALFFLIVFSNFIGYNTTANPNTLVQDNDENKNNNINNNNNNKNKENEEKGETIKYLTTDLFEVMGDNVVNAKEYQLKLDQEFWTDRDLALSFFLPALRNATGLALGDGNMSVREQISYDTPRCGKNVLIRVRNYVYGHQINESTIDIKTVSSSGLENLLLKKIERTNTIDPYLSTSIQKIEQDVHPCKEEKWSRETRITNVPFKPDLAICKNIIQYFPKAFISENGIGDDKLKKLIGQPTNPRDITYWYTLTHDGYLKNGAKFRSAFTLSYNSFEDAKFGNVTPNKKSEWSMRIWSKNDGLDDIFDPDILADTRRIYDSLLNIFGSGDEWPCIDNQL